MMPSKTIFSAITPEEFSGLTNEALKDYEHGVKKLLGRKKTHTFHSLLVPLERLKHKFDEVWNPIRHLVDVKQTPELVEANKVAKKAVSEFLTKLFQNKELYQAIKHLKDDKSFKKRSQEQRQLIKEYLKGFEANGVHLEPAKQARFSEVKKELTDLQQTFVQNKTQSIKNWTLHITDSKEVSGLPQQLLNEAAKNAKEKGIDGWVFTLAPNMVMDVFKFADSRQLRQTFHQAYYTLASPLGEDKSLDNGPIMSRILELRQELATIRGFDDYVDLALDNRMAKRSDVSELIYGLSQTLRPQAEKEFALIKQLAKTHYDIDEVQPYDLGYLSAKLKEHNFKIDDKKVAEYFPHDKVLLGMFTAVNKLFGLEVKEEENFDAWDPDVMLFSIYDSEGEKLGEVYMDLFARNGEKRAGAWMNECDSRYIGKSHHDLPSAFLSTNFGKGEDGKPALLSHRQVQTTFHEFGHCLHHILAKSKYPSLCGPDAVPRDAVESPSMMMENWVWEKEGLQLFSGHYQTGDVLPDEMIEAIKATRYYNDAIGTLGQLCYGRFDYEVHQKKEKQSSESMHALWQKVRNETQVHPTTDYDHMPFTFHHIFNSGYAAGYYTYCWSENLAQNFYAEFEKNGIFDKDTAKRYQELILANGGIYPFMDSVKTFLGHAPKPDALSHAIQSNSPVEKLKVPEPKKPDTMPSKTSKANIKLPPSHMFKWPAILGAGSTILRFAVLGATMMSSLLIGAVTFAFAYMASEARSLIKQRALKSYNATNEPSSKTEIRSYEAGVKSALSTQAQVKSCFMWETYRHPTAYYAGMAAKENGEEAKAAPKKKVSL